MGQVSKLQVNELVNISIQYSSKLEKLCQYLRDNFNIQHVVYTAILPNKSYLSLSSHTDYLSDYFASALHTVCPFLNSDDKASIPRIYMPFLKIDDHYGSLAKHRHLCEKHGLYQPLVFSVFNENIQEIFTFFHSSPSLQVVNLYLNSTNKLQSYISFFKKSISDIVEEYVNQLPLSFSIFSPERVSSIFKETTGQINTYDSVNNSVDHLIKVIPKLTFREAQVLQFYLEYRSAKEIARYTDLSTRTVEKHIENFKKKIGLRKKEMILKKINDMLADPDHSTLE